MRSPAWSSSSWNGGARRRAAEALNRKGYAEPPGGLVVTALATVVLFILGGVFFGKTQLSVLLQPVADSIKGPAGR